MRSPRLVVFAVVAFVVCSEVSFFIHILNLYLANVIVQGTPTPSNQVVGLMRSQMEDIKMMNILPQLFDEFIRMIRDPIPGSEGAARDMIDELEKIFSYKIEMVKSSENNRPIVELQMSDLKGDIIALQDRLRIIGEALFGKKI